MMMTTSTKQPPKTAPPKSKIKSRTTAECPSWPAREAATPTLRFTPDAWAKLLFFCHYGETEIGGFGVSAADDPLRIEQFITIKQHTTAVTVAFDDEAVADHFDAQVDAGRRPEQFARIWLHTHPGNSPTPSQVDEETFARVFGACDWAVMFILACGGKTYCRLRFNVGPGGTILIPVSVDYSRAFDSSDQEAWADEYERNVHVERLQPTTVEPTGSEGGFDELLDRDDPTLEELQLLNYRDEVFHEYEDAL